MARALEDRLLQHLRAALDAPVAFAGLPERLTGGFDAAILAFALQGAPEAFRQPLVLRLMPREADGARVRRETATQDAVAAQGYPAPKVLMSWPDPEPLGRPFVIMQRLAGRSMLANAFGPEQRPGYVLGLSSTLARAHARLHALDPGGLKRALLGADFDPDEYGLAGEIRRMIARIDSADLDGLRAGAAWLQRHRPRTNAAPVICHGGFHPLNLVMDGPILSGVVDWSQTIVAPAAYDVAATMVLLRFGPIEAPPGLQPWLDAARALPIRRYLDFYRAERALETADLPYFECLCILSALSFEDDLDAGTSRPWSEHAGAALRRRFEHVTRVRISL